MGELRRTRGADAVDEDFGVVVVIDPDEELAGRVLRPGERAAHPDLLGLPWGPDRGVLADLGAESGLALLPARVGEPGCGPVRRRLGERVAPPARLGPRAGQENLGALVRHE